jgi:hypothetical protein
LPTKIFFAGVPRNVKSSSLMVSMTGVTTCCFPSAIRASNGVSHPKLSKKQESVKNSMLPSYGLLEIFAVVKFTILEI